MSFLFFLGGGDSAFALVLVGGLTPFFFPGVGCKSVVIPLLIGFWKESTGEFFSKGVGSDVFRLLGGLCKGGRGSLAFHPCSRGRANADLLVARAGGVDSDSIPLLTSFVLLSSTKFCECEEGGDGDVIRLLNGVCKGAPRAFFGVHSAFSFFCRRRLFFFFGGGGEKCHYPAFDWDGKSFFFFWGGGGVGGEVSDVSPLLASLSLSFFFLCRFSFCPCFGGRANAFFFQG